MKIPNTTEPEARAQLRRLGLFGLAASWQEIADKPWLPELIRIEEAERQRRSLARRLRTARIGSFKSIADFDWQWPKKIDRQAIDDLFNLSFLDDGIGVLQVEPPVPK